MDRVFSLIGVNVHQSRPTGFEATAPRPAPRSHRAVRASIPTGRWYKLEMKRSMRPPLDRPLPASGPGARGATIVGYFESEHCVLCDKRCRRLLCDECEGDRAAVAVALATRRRLVESRYDAVVRHCLSCAGVRDGPVECRNLDCPHLYARLKLERQCATAIEQARDMLSW